MKIIKLLCEIMIIFSIFFIIGAVGGYERELCNGTQFVRMLFSGFVVLFISGFVYGYIENHE